VRIRTPKARWEFRISVTVFLPASIRLLNAAVLLFTEIVTTACGFAFAIACTAAVTSSVFFG